MSYSADEEGEDDEAHKGKETQEEKQQKHTESIFTVQLFFSRVGHQLTHTNFDGNSTFPHTKGQSRTRSRNCYLQTTI